MKYWLFVFSFISLFANANAYTNTLKGPCHGGSQSEWKMIVCVDDRTGKIMSASGIDCNGNAWSKNYLMGDTSSASGSTSGSGSNSSNSVPTVKVNSIGGGILNITSSVVSTFQIIDLATGNYIGYSVGPCTANTPYSISLSSLPPGHAYGVITFDANGNAIFFYSFIL